MDSSCTPVDSPARTQAEAAHVAMLDSLDACATASDPEAAVALALDILRSSAEVRLRCEVVLGRLLVSYPDPGGRPRVDGPQPVHRSIRRLLGCPRHQVSSLMAASQAPEHVIEAAVDELWAGYPQPVTSGHIVLRLARQHAPTPASVAPATAQPEAPAP